MVLNLTFIAKSNSHEITAASLASFNVNVPILQKWRAASPIKTPFQVQSGSALGTTSEK